MVEQNRSFVTFLLLTIVTCGIYSLYFWYKYAEDVNRMCAGDGQETTGGGTLILLWLFTCGIYPLIWYYSVGNRLKMNGTRYGVNVQEDGQTILLWTIIGMFIGIGAYIGAYFLIKNANDVAAAYNQRNGGAYAAY